MITRRDLSRFIAAVAVLALALCLAGPAAAADTPAWSGKCVEVLDGDSLVVMRGREPVQIRLYGVDAPEKGQPFADEAREFTRRLIGQRVKVNSTDVDRHGRVVAQVWWGPEKEYLNAALLSAGLAWWYARYAPADADLARAWWAALQARRGLWGADAPQVPPWDWRRIKAAAGRIVLAEVTGSAPAYGGGPGPEAAPQASPPPPQAEPSVPPTATTTESPVTDEPGGSTQATTEAPGPIEATNSTAPWLTPTGGPKKPPTGDGGYR